LQMVCIVCVVVAVCQCYNCLGAVLLLGSIETAVLLLPLHLQAIAEGGAAAGQAAFRRTLTRCVAAAAAALLCRRCLLRVVWLAALPRLRRWPSCYF
jgi:hypothetical protein